jgi:Flp pilus assembly protein TadG
MNTLASIGEKLISFLSDEDGIAMTEALLAVPFLTLLAAGMLEFGSVFWQREQIETGLRDAARYMARCRHGLSASLPSNTNCQTVARNLAYYGSSAATTALRVPDWNATNSPITFSFTATTPVCAVDNVTATTTHNILHSPIFGFLGIDEITISANHSQKMICW